MRVDPQGWLAADSGEEVHHVPSARHNPLVVPKPIYPVWHWSAGSGKGYGLKLSRSIAELPPEGTRGASWHLLVDRQGIVWQSVSCLRGAWHCRGVREVDGVRRSINGTSVGIELENWGPVERVDGKFYRSPYWIDRLAEKRMPDPAYEIPQSRTCSWNGPGAWYYDTFTVQQEATSAAIIRCLAAEFGWKREQCLLGHSDLDPERKIDPGPLWKELVLPRVLEVAFGDFSQPA